MIVFFGIILILSGAKSSSDECDKTYTAESGEIRSPGFSSYPNNADCSYTIKGRSHVRTVEFTFESFNTEEGYDFLYVGKDKYHGTVSTGTHLNYSFKNSFTLRFTSDGDNTVSGFIIKYKLLSGPCPKGLYGTKCADECSIGCKPDTCKWKDGTCHCIPGWLGNKCDREKLQAEAKFYCFKIREQNTLMLRVDQRGTRYRTVTAYNKDGTESPGCNNTRFNHFKLGGVATLKVTQQANKEFTPTCGEEEMSEDVVTWKFKFQEFPMTSSAYDVLFEVTCDFKKADTLTRLLTSNSEKSSNKTTTLSETKVSVSLDVIDPFAEQPLTTVKLGQQVKLQLKLINSGGFGVTAIAPYNCSASTLDGVHSVLFKDDKGCSPEDSQIVFNPTLLTKWQSELFEAFTFQGYDKINIQCQFHVCFSEEHNFCRDTCAHSKKRKNRKLHRRRRHDKNNPNDEEWRELGTTVNIMT